MTDYLNKYKDALRNGDTEQAQKYYRKYRGKDSTEDEAEKSDDDGQEESDEDLKDPSGMTVSEVKDYVGDDAVLASEVLKYEKEDKNRTTLVDHLESVSE